VRTRNLVKQCGLRVLTLHRLAKVHKKCVPQRSIISTVEVPTFTVAKELHSCQHSFKSSDQFIHSHSKLVWAVTKEILVSLDAILLFTNILIREV